MNSILVKEQNQFAHMTRFEVRPTVQLRSRIETADHRFGLSIGKNAYLKSSAATRGTVSFARRREDKLRLKLDCELHHRMSNLVSYGVIHLRRGEDPAEPRQPTRETRAGALARPARTVDGAVDNRPKRFRFRHFKVVDLHLGKLGVKLILAVAGNDAVVERLGIGEEFALIAIGRQVPGIAHNLDDLADPAYLVSQGALLSSRRLKTPMAVGNGAPAEAPNTPRWHHCAMINSNRLLYGAREARLALAVHSARACG